MPVNNDDRNNNGRYVNRNELWEHFTQEKLFELIQSRINQTSLKGEYSRPKRDGTEETVSGAKNILQFGIKRNTMVDLQKVFNEYNPAEAPSVQTLRRLFGNQNDGGKRVCRSTLNFIASFLGYDQWEEIGTQRGESTLVHQDLYTIDDYSIGDKICISDGRHEFKLQIVDDHDWGKVFRVESVKNSSNLRKGDLLRIDSFGKSAHLIVRAIIRDGEQGDGYDSGNNIISIQRI